MARVDADRNLLLGILAQQMDFVTREALFEAMNAWIIRKEIPLGAVLVERGYLAKSRCDLLEALVDEHVRAHGGDPARSLQALSSVDSVAEVIGRLSDGDVQASIGHLRSDGTIPPSGDVPETRVTGTLGQPTSWNGRFRVVRPHASGGLGVVSVALDDELDREVAYKEIKDSRADDRGSRARFVLEAEITGKLEHPGIIPIYGLGHDLIGRPFYAMRFIRGDSLADAINRFHDPNGPYIDPVQRSLQLRELLGRFLDVCDAMAYAHSRGVLHRDLKPGNVMLGPFGETLVVDWGLALPMDRIPEGHESTQSPVRSTKADNTSLPREQGQAIGTPAYMSPEQAEGAIEKLGPRSDVYGLGSILYDLLTGKRPIEGASLEEVLRRVVRGEIKPPRQVCTAVPAALDAVCLKALALRPEDRYPTPRTLATDIKAWLADEPVSAYRAPLPQQFGRWARRHRTTVVALGLSLATAVVLLSCSVILVGVAQRETAKALHQVVKEQGRTTEALRRADSNFGRARQAVEDYLTTVSQETLLDEPGMLPLRRRLLSSALEYHRGFLREYADDPRLVLELAESHRRYANLTGVNEHGEDALPHLRMSLALIQELALKHPSDLKYQRLIATTLNDLGQYFDKRGLTQDALASHKSAIDLFDSLLRDRPRDQELQEGLAIALAQLGRLRSRQQGDGEIAGRLLQRAREILHRLIAGHPDTIRYRMRLGELHNHLYGVFIGDGSRQVEAFQASQDALNVFNELLLRVPNSPRLRSQLATIHINRMLILDRLKRFQEAVREGREARRILSEVVRDNPSILLYQHNLARTCTILGYSLTAKGANEQAIDCLRQAADAFERIIADGSTIKPSYLEYVSMLNARGSALASLGRFEESVADHQRAAEIASDLCRKDPKNLFLQGEAMVNIINMGYSLADSGRYTEAIAAFEQGQAIAREFFSDDLSHIGIDNIVHQLYEAYALREIGRGREADSIAEKARIIAGRDKDRWYYLARYDARGATLLEQGFGASKTVIDLKLRAMDQLDRAVSLGYSNSKAMQSDEGLKSIRQLPAFPLLMMDAAMPPDPYEPLRKESEVVK